MRFFPSYHATVGFVTFGLAGCAIFFSVVGIAELFSGNYWAVLFMATFLEMGKLVSASAAYVFRHALPWWVRSFLVFFSVTICLVTSLGIFSFLSSSFQEVRNTQKGDAVQIEATERRLRVFEARSDRLDETLTQLESQKATLESLQNDRGWLTERQDERLSRITERVPTLDARMEASRDSVLQIQQRLASMEVSEVTDSKLGPVRFLSESMGLDGSKATFYFILVLVSVFDPMVFVLVLTLSMTTDFEERWAEQRDSVDQHEGSPDAGSSLPKLDIPIAEHPPPTTTPQPEPNNTAAHADSDKEEGKEEEPAARFFSFQDDGEGWNLGVS